MDIFGDTDSELSSSDYDSDEESERENEPVITSHPRRVRTRGGRQPQVAPRRQTNEWTSWVDAPFIPDLPSFTDIPGPTVPLPESAFEFVKIFLNDEFINLITFETNRYDGQFLQKTSMTPNARAQKWKPVTYNVRFC